MKRALVIGNALAIALVILYGLVEYGGPIYAQLRWEDEYKTLMFKCDHAMKEHYIAKRAVETIPTGQTIKGLQASEVALLDCHDYDKMRKRMIVWGVSDAQLSAIGLEAMESKGYELSRFVQIHEFRY